MLDFDEAIAFIEKVVQDRKINGKTRVDLLQMLIDSKDHQDSGVGLTEEIICHSLSARLIALKLFIGNFL